VTPEHEAIKKQALDAVNSVFGDTSADQQTTIDSLREIIDCCEDFITSIEADLKNAEDEDDEDN
jgi:hypothetical protein